jgi:hypothetical protein
MSSNVHFCGNCHMVLRPIDDDDPDACQCGAPCEEDTVCLCGDSRCEAQCDCLAPSVIVEVRFEVRATDRPSLPRFAATFAENLLEGLPREWFEYQGAHSYRITNEVDARLITG